ncbi:YqzG/YhdC family protein [Virgibacillus ndiopensis]|uniref:YqzG/YhdC family protein n=1 Tax=Virgibacillus ndiopensis TaxID=2004408 RepID=UPI000C06851B|nr:YqzG/YhdC family protein [Virgibacillus ndiopensis]
MRKLITIVVLSMIFFLGYSNLNVVHTKDLEKNIYAKKEIPPYAKWGRLAMKETKARYPNADIVDYLHVGRDVRGKSSIEKFKLWLKEGNKEFGVYVNVEFDNQTEEILKVSFNR